MDVKTTTENFGNYDFALTAEQEARAGQLHNESIIVDMLFQGPCGYRSFTKEMESQIEADWKNYHDPAQSMFSSQHWPIRLAVAGEFPDFKECWDQSGITAATRDVQFASFELFAETSSLATAQFDHFPWLIKALKSEDIRRAKSEGNHAGIINTQLSRGMMANLLELLDSAYHIGLRMLQLTYNRMNLIGAGCGERTDAGVSNYGAQVIAKLNKLGVIVDTGHCGRQTTLDACTLSNTPVVASHTTAEAIFKFPRAKSDEELRAIAATGGVVGVCALPYFLSAGEGLTIDVMLDHIDYIVNLIGWNQVGIGTDWPLQMPKFVSREPFATSSARHGLPNAEKYDRSINLIGFDDYRDFPNITRGLVKRGYNDEQIKGILGYNFLRVFKDVCD